MFLLGNGLESTVTEFGARIDEFEVDLLQCPSLGLHKKRLRCGGEKEKRFTIDDKALAKNRLEKHPNFSPIISKSFE